MPRDVEMAARRAPATVRAWVPEPRCCQIRKRLPTGDWARMEPGAPQDAVQAIRARQLLPAPDARKPQRRLPRSRDSVHDRGQGPGIAAGCASGYRARAGRADASRKRRRHIPKPSTTRRDGRGARRSLTRPWKTSPDTSFSGADD
jgi:hypothetical protein